jgi:hypothetical protein
VKPIDVEMEQQVSSLESLWGEVLPDFEAPFRSRFRSWLQIGPLERVEYAINRTARKAWKAGREGRPMNSGQARSYCQHVLENEAGIQREGEGWHVVREERESRAT